jgi:hypothetical protein
MLVQHQDVIRRHLHRLSPKSCLQAMRGDISVTMYHVIPHTVVYGM